MLVSWIQSRSVNIPCTLDSKLPWITADNTLTSASAPIQNSELESRVPRSWHKTISTREVSDEKMTLEWDDLVADFACMINCRPPVLSRVRYSDLIRRVPSFMIRTLCVSRSHLIGGGGAGVQESMAGIDPLCFNLENRSIAQFIYLMHAERPPILKKLLTTST